MARSRPHQLHDLFQDERLQPLELAVVAPQVEERPRGRVGLVAQLRRVRLPGDEVVFQQLLAQVEERPALADVRQRVPSDRRGPHVPRPPDPLQNAVLEVPQVDQGVGRLGHESLHAERLIGDHHQAGSVPRDEMCGKNRRVHKTTFPRKLRGSTYFSTASPSFMNFTTVEMSFRVSNVEHDPKHSSSSLHDTGLCGYISCTIPSCNFTSTHHATWARRFQKLTRPVASYVELSPVHLPLLSTTRSPLGSCNW